MTRPSGRDEFARRAHRASLLGAALYLLVAGLWVLVSDQVVARLVSEPALLIKLQTLKGLGFILVTAVALYFIIRRAVRLALRSAQLERQLHYDALTGLPNRALLLSMMPPALTMARQRGAGVAVVAVHVDGLRQINESLGVAAGDQVLVAVAGRLRALIPPGDLLARATGNTFVAVSEDSRDTEQALDIARAVLRSMAEPLTVNDVELRIGASIGISRFPEDHAEADALLRAAEAALTKARTDTGWRVRLYSAGLTEASSASFHLENELRKAIDGGQLKLSFQPQIRLSDGRAVGVEALLRWHHPELGEIPPSRFVPLAERTGLILPMSEWLLQEACAQARRWQDEALHPPLRMAVNLSGQQFGYRRLGEKLQELLERNRLNANALELEITENVTMQDPARAARVISELKELGFGIAIDDFGTGHSSLAYLRDLPVDRIKIDASFLRGIPGDRRNTAICRTIVRLGRDLDLTTVAEGIESEEQRQILLDAGCDEGQGYLFGRPMSADELRRWLQAR